MSKKTLLIPVSLKLSCNDVITFEAGFIDGKYAETDAVRNGGSGDDLSHTETAQIDGYTISGDDWRLIEAEDALETILSRHLIDMEELEPVLSDVVDDLVRINEHAA